MDLFKCLQARLVVTCSSRRIVEYLSTHNIRTHLQQGRCWSSAQEESLSLSRSHTRFLVGFFFFLVRVCVRGRVGNVESFFIFYIFLLKMWTSKMGRPPPSVTGG